MTTPANWLQLGELAITETTIYAPGTTMPLAGSRWTIVDMRTSRTRIPPLIVACAVIFGVLLCGLGLFLLLITETVVTGNVRVSVASGSQGYTTELPIYNEAQLRNLRATVEWLQQKAYAVG